MFTLQIHKFQFNFHIQDFASDFHFKYQQILDLLILIFVKGKINFAI